MFARLSLLENYQRDPNNHGMWHRGLSQPLRILSMFVESTISGLNVRSYGGQLDIVSLEKRYRGYQTHELRRHPPMWEDWRLCRQMKSTEMTDKCCLFGQNRNN